MPATPTARRRPHALALVVLVVLVLSACQAGTPASTSADRAAAAADCTGSGCSDDGEFIGGPTAGDVARQQAGRPAAAAAADVQVPSLVGLTPADAADVAEEHGLRLANGSVGSYGVVSSQTPRAGSRVRPGSSILVSVDYSAG